MVRRTLSRKFTSKEHTFIRSRSTAMPSVNPSSSDLVLNKPTAVDVNRAALDVDFAYRWERLQGMPSNRNSQQIYDIASQ